MIGCAVTNAQGEARLVSLIGGTLLRRKRVRVRRRGNGRGDDRGDRRAIRRWRAGSYRGCRRSYDGGRCGCQRHGWLSRRNGERGTRDRRRGDGRTGDGHRSQHFARPLQASPVDFVQRLLVRQGPAAHNFRSHVVQRVGVMVDRFGTLRRRGAWMGEIRKPDVSLSFRRTAANGK